MSGVNVEAQKVPKRETVEILLTNESTEELPRNELAKDLPTKDNELRTKEAEVC